MTGFNEDVFGYCCGAGVEVFFAAVAKGDGEFVSFKVSEAEVELVMSDGFEDDVFEGEFCEVVFGDVVEGDVLGCYGVAVFGSSPADAFWADCKPFFLG